MNENIKGTPLDYSDTKVSVYFEIGGIKLREIRQVIENIDLIDTIQYSEYGLEVMIPIQIIPEIVLQLTKEEIAIYAINRK